MNNRQLNKLNFLNEVYSKEETRNTMFSSYNNNIKYIEDVLDKDLMYFTPDEIEMLLINATGISRGYKSSIYSFCNAYCMWAEDKGEINVNPVNSIQAESVLNQTIENLMRGLMGLETFYNTISLLEVESNGLSILPLLLARYGVMGNKADSLVSLEDKDVDKEGGFIRIINKTNNSPDFGKVLTELPVDKRFIEVYNKLIAIKEYNGMGTRKGIIEVIPSPYVIKRTTYANKNSTEEKVSINTVLNSIMRNCADAGINRISLSKMVLSRKLDLLLDIRKNRFLVEEDFNYINKLFNPEAKSIQGAVNLMRFYKDISAEEVGKQIKLDDNGVEFVKKLRVRINFI